MTQVVLEEGCHTGTSNVRSASPSPSPGNGGRKTVTASGKREKKVERVALRRVKEVKPERVIPLEEENFKEF
jgi:hypothetical protein